MKRLYRSEKDKVLAGILGGIAEYVEVDPVLIRLFYIAVTIFTGVAPGIIVYLVALFIVPKASQSVVTQGSAPNQKEPEIR